MIDYDVFNQRKVVLLVKCSGRQLVANLPIPVRVSSPAPFAKDPPGVVSGVFLRLTATGRKRGGLAWVGAIDRL